MTDLATDIRLGELERQNARLKKWLVALSGVVVILWWFSGEPAGSTAASPTASTLRARELVIEDAAGKAAITLSAAGDIAQDGDASIELVAKGAKLKLEVRPDVSSIHGDQGDEHSQFHLASGRAFAGTRVTHRGKTALVIADDEVPRMHLFGAAGGQQTMVSAREVLAGRSPADLAADAAQRPAER